ncbi:MAG TPA: hypothetical protein VJ774_02330 [Actinomycetota bacterium]|nr:hypothetical protein [Actinomycetota bacterium]
MSGKNVGRKRKWPWAILSVLFALTLAWSFAVMGDEVGDVWSIVRIGSAVGLGLSLLRLVVVSISSRRRRRGRKGDGRRTDVGEAAEAEGESSGEQAHAEDHARTYEEVFGLQVEQDGDGLPPSPEDEQWEIEPERQPSADEQSAEEPASISDEDVHAPRADGDEEAARVDTLDPGAGSEEHLRRMREEFRARAQEAALRVKQREAELHEAASVADHER